MATFESSVLQEDNDHALLWAFFTASFRTRMIASLERSRARLKAQNSVVKNFRMAFLNAGMSASQALDTAQVATSFRRELRKIVRG
jgi:hypothetical protein